MRDHTQAAHTRAVRSTHPMTILSSNSWGFGSESTFDIPAGAIAAPTGAALVPETGHDVALMGAAIHSETGHDIMRLEVLAFGEAAVLEKSKVTSKSHRICERLPRDAGFIVNQRWHH